MLGTIASACGPASKTEPATPAGPAGVSGRCPDPSKVDELVAFDFARELAVSHASGELLKAAMLAAIEMNALGDKLDAELGIACAQIAHDLGNKGDWRSGNDACAAASTTVEEARARLGPKAQPQLVVRTPLCLTDAALVTKCASICDSSAPANSVHAECDSKVGRCDGNCDGTCELKAPGKCAGTCSGACEGQMRGTCGGRCTGTCDGKRASGAACTGTCAGTCDRGAVEAECMGICNGACKLARAGICDGICAGTCSVELAETRCAHEPKIPAVSADCRARCELAMINQTECAAPKAGYLVTGLASAKEREAGEAMKNAVDTSFPGLLKVLFELGENGPKRVESARALVERTRTSFKDLALSGASRSTAAASEAQLAKCFDEPFKKAVANADLAKTSIEKAVAVRAAVSK